MIIVTSHIHNFLLVLLIISLFSCSDNEIRVSSKGLQDDEVRGKVLQIDGNKSLVSFRVTAAGSSLSEFSDVNLQDVLDVEVQPGDLNLLDRKGSFKGRLQSHL